MDILKLRSTLTSRYQTTIPAAIREALEIGKNDSIGYVLTSAGKVELIKEAAEKGPEDDALGPFLKLLDAHIAYVSPSNSTVVAYDKDDPEEDLALATRLSLLGDK
jgi:antitoxin PrlF